MGGLYHGWSDEPDQHADFVHGAVPIEDFDETFRHKKKRGKKNPRPKGCPANDGKAHVYVWIPMPPEKFFWSGAGDYEIKVCCGCEKRAGGKSFRRVEE